MDFKNIKSRTDIPNDISVVKDMLWTAILHNVKLSDQLAYLRKQAFGQKSEKLSDSSCVQTQLDELLAQIPELAPSPVKETDFITVKTTEHKRRKKHPGRNVIPDDITTETQVIDVCDNIKNCEACPKKNTCNRSELPIIDKTTRIIVERTAPKYVKYVQICIKRACPLLKNAVHVAEPPLISPIEKGKAGIGLLLFVITSKYLYHLPLYRIQRQIFHESRIWFTRSTMVGWIAQMYALFKPVHKAMVEAVKKSPVIWSDDSLVKRVTKDLGPHTSYMWTYLGGDQGRTVVFDYRETRSSAAPREFLKGVAATTYLMTDGCQSYDDAVKRYALIQMACMMHIRRDFVEALDCGRHVQFTRRILRRIGQLYRIERYATAKDLSDEERGKLRIIYSAEIMAQIKIDLLDPQLRLLPEEKLTKAINYALNHWGKACVFLTRGDLPIDNGPSERTLRDLAIGRKNWLFIGSDEGGKRMAILMSIIQTCKINCIDIEEYFRDVSMRLCIRPENANCDDLTPIAWLKAKNGGELPKLKELYPSKH